MATLDQLVVRITGDTAQFESAMKRTQARMRAVGESATRMGRTMSIAITAPLALAGVAAVKAGVQFEASLSKIVGLVGVAREQVAAWRNDILQMAPTVGKGPGELAEALFFVTSAGARGAKAIEILRLSAQAATAGLGKTSVVADAVTSAINAYGEANLEAGKATGILVAAVREGKAEASEIAGAMGIVLATAAQLGVSFDQVAAAVATMTKFGIDANTAVTSLRGTLNAFIKITPAAEKELTKFGLSSAALRRTIREEGLLAALLQIKQAIGDNEVAMASIVPDVRALQAVLTLVGKNATIAEEVFASLARTTERDLTQAFEEAASTSQHVLRRLVASIRVRLIEIADAILPTVIPALRTFTDALERVAAVFRNMDPAFRKFIIGVTALAAAIGPALLVFGTLAGVISKMISPIGRVTTLIIGGSGLVAAFSSLTKSADRVTTALKTAAGALAGMFILRRVGRIIGSASKAFAEAANATESLATAGAAGGLAAVALAGRIRVLRGIVAALRIALGGVISIFGGWLGLIGAVGGAIVIHLITAINRVTGAQERLKESQERLNDIQREARDLTGELKTATAERAAEIRTSLIPALDAQARAEAQVVMMAIRARILELERIAQRPSRLLGRAAARIGPIREARREIAELREELRALQAEFPIRRPITLTPEAAPAAEPGGVGEEERQGRILRFFGALESRREAQRALAEATARVETRMLDEALRRAEVAKKQRKTVAETLDDIRQQNRVLQLIAAGEEDAARIVEARAEIEERIGRELLPAELEELKKQMEAQAKFNAQIEKAAAEESKLVEGAKDFSRVISTAFEDAILRAKDFGDVLRGLGQQILQIIARILVTAPLERELTRVFSGVDILGSIFGGIGSFFSSILPFQAGGPIRAFQPALVGERGPELFVPRTAGQIVPTPALARRPEVVVNQVINVSTGVAQTVRAEMLAFAPVLVEQTIAAVDDAVERRP